MAAHMFVAGRVAALFAVLAGFLYLGYEVGHRFIKSRKKNKESESSEAQDEDVVSASTSGHPADTAGEADTSHSPEADGSHIQTELLMASQLAFSISEPTEGQVDIEKVEKVESDSETLPAALGSGILQATGVALNFTRPGSVVDDTSEEHGKKGQDDDGKDCHQDKSVIDKQTSFHTSSEQKDEDTREDQTKGSSTAFQGTTASEKTKEDTKEDQTKGSGIPFQGTGTSEKTKEDTKEDQTKGSGVPFQGTSASEKTKEDIKEDQAKDSAVAFEGASAPSTHTAWNVRNPDKDGVVILKAPPRSHGASDKKTGSRATEAEEEKSDADQEYEIPKAPPPSRSSTQDLAGEDASEYPAPTISTRDCGLHEETPRLISPVISNPASYGLLGPLSDMKSDGSFCIMEEADEDSKTDSLIATPGSAESLSFVTDNFSFLDDLSTGPPTPVSPISPASYSGLPQRTLSKDPEREVVQEEVQAVRAVPRESAPGGVGADIHGHYGKPADSSQVVESGSKYDSKSSEPVMLTSGEELVQPTSSSVVESVPLDHQQGSPPIFQSIQKGQEMSPVMVKPPPGFTYPTASRPKEEVDHPSQGKLELHSEETSPSQPQAVQETSGTQVKAPPGFTQPAAMASGEDARQKDISSAETKRKSEKKDKSNRSKVSKEEVHKALAALTKPMQSHGKSIQSKVSKPRHRDIPNTPWSESSQSDTVPSPASHDVQPVPPQPVEPIQESQSWASWSQPWEAKPMELPPGAAAAGGAEGWADFSQSAFSEADPSTAALFPQPSISKQPVASPWAAPAETKLPETALEREPLLGVQGNSLEQAFTPNETAHNIPGWEMISQGAAEILASGILREESSESSASSSSASSVRGSLSRESTPEVQVPSEEASDTLKMIGQDAFRMTRRHAEVLVALLTSKNMELREKALVTIGNAAAFTMNQNLLREVGCLPRVCRMLRSHSMALQVGHNIAYPSLVTAVTQSIANLAVNEENQKQLKDCIPALIDFTVSDKSSETIQLTALQALTNLSVTPNYHTPYTKVVQHLYEFVDKGSPAVRLQALKVLVNLSCNADIVPHLLAAKSPASMLDLLVPATADDLLVRWMTLLANVMSTVRDNAITYATLPTDYKAPSPETMYTAIYGLNNVVQLRSRVFVLSKHHNEDVRYNATRIYSCLL